MQFFIFKYLMTKKQQSMLIQLPSILILDTGIANYVFTILEVLPYSDSGIQYLHLTYLCRKTKQYVA